MAEDNTRLNAEFELSRQAIIDGDKPEFEPVERPRKERRPMYLASPIDGFLDKTFDDLRDAYKLIDDLTQEKTELQNENAKLSKQLQTAQGEAGVAQSDVEQLESLTKTLDETNAMIERFKAENAKDKRAINAEQEKVKKLQVQLNQMQARMSSTVSEQEFADAQAKIDELNGELAAKTTEYDQVTADVNEILDSLQEQFAGLTVADDE